ncbi:unnamed protein product, partial [Closterium sp. Naga37s-1]
SPLAGSARCCSAVGYCRHAPSPSPLLPPPTTIQPLCFCCASFSSFSTLARSSLLLLYCHLDVLAAPIHCNSCCMPPSPSVPPTFPACGSRSSSSSNWEPSAVGTAEGTFTAGRQRFYQGEYGAGCCLSRLLSLWFQAASGVKEQWQASKAHQPSTCGTGAGRGLARELVTQQGGLSLQGGRLQQLAAAITRDSYQAYVFRFSRTCFLACTHSPLPFPPLCPIPSALPHSLRSAPFPPPCPIPLWTLMMQQRKLSGTLATPVAAAEAQRSSAEPQCGRGGRVYGAASKW